MKKTKMMYRLFVLPGVLLAVFVAVSLFVCAIAAEDGVTSIHQARTFCTDNAGNTRVAAAFAEHEHHYDRPDWTWADDYSSATATFTCSCGDVQTVDAEITEAEVTPADCTTEQVAIFTATVTFGGETFTDETDEVSVPGTACHVYGIRITPATCTHDGITTYQCVRCGHTFTKNPVPAFGHKDDDQNGLCDYCDEPVQNGQCKWCGKTHEGFWQSIVGFLHKIFYFWAHLFGRR